MGAWLFFRYEFGRLHLFRAAGREKGSISMNQQELLDRAELTDLVMRYSRGVDRRDFALIRSTYHDDAIDDHGEMF